MSSTAPTARPTRRPSARTTIGLLITAGVALALYIAFWPKPTPGRVVPIPTQAYYVDLETGAETVQSIDNVPPLPGESGRPSIVRAICFSSDGGKTHLVGYYEKYSENAKSLLETLPEDDKQARWREIELGHYVRSPARGARWVQYQSEEGEAVKAAVYQDHPDLQLAPSSPP